jgi:uncharacterized protein (DUF362 family)
VSDEIKKPELNRRRFLEQSAKAGLALAGAACLGLGLFDNQGPSGQSAASRITLPGFAAKDGAGRLAVARGSERGKCLAAAFEAMGGLKDFIAPGETVLLKPNVAFASAPAIGATTHPELLAAAIRLCKKAGAAQVLVTDNPIQDPAACFRFSGLARVCREEGARLMLPGPGSFADYSLKGGSLLKNWPVLYQPLKLADRVIGLAPVKDHHRSKASLSIKNWYGLLGGQRAVFHQAIFQIIKELGQMIRPTLVVLDGIQSMVRNGPTGGSLADLKDTGTLIVSSDQVAADVLGAELLGLGPAEVPYLAWLPRPGWAAWTPRRFRPNTWRWAEMILIWTRRISQAFFLLLVHLVQPGGQLGREPGGSLRGWPVNWFQELDPLLALGTLLSTGTLHGNLWWAGITLGLTLILGRFFCGWVCPFGTLHHLTAGWPKGKKRKERIRANRPHPAQNLKYYILLAMLAAASGGLGARLLMGYLSGGGPSSQLLGPPWPAWACC